MRWQKKRHLNLRQIEAFRAVVMLGSVTAASKHLNITQPAVTRLISDFEFELGFRLFERTNRGMTPTADARMLYEEVERSFVGLDTIAEAADAIANRTVGQLRVVAQPVYADTIVSQAIGQFLSSRPRVRIVLEAAPLPQLVELVSTRRFDLGVSVGLANRSDLDVVSVGRQRAVAARGKRGGRHGGVLDIAELARSRLVVLQDQSPFRHAVVQYLQEAGWVPDILCEVRTQVAACTVARESGAIAIVDSCMADVFADEALEFLELSPSLSWSVDLATPADVTPSGTLTALHNCLAEAFASHQFSASPPPQN